MLQIGDKVNALIYPNIEVVGTIIGFDGNLALIQGKDKLQYKTLISMCAKIN